MNKQNKILWIRELSCGHERPTNINFIIGNYEKPKRNKNAYCRECLKSIKIVKVRKADKQETASLIKLGERK